MEVLIINGHDYSKYIERKGYSWQRNDLDSSSSGRVKSGKMRRDKVAEKRSLPYKMRYVPQSVLAQLDTDLSDPEFTAKYLDVHGIMEKTFYCTSLKADVVEVRGEDSIWDNVSFTLTEV